VRVQDQDAPVVTVPADVTTEATGPNGAIASYRGQGATDNVDGPLTPACTPISGSRFGLGATTVTCTATDDAGNLGSNGFKVKVVDTTGPVVTVPADLAVTATSSAGARVSFSAPSATDLVDGSVQPRCDRAPGSVFTPGVTTVSCSATDAAGNTTTKRFTVGVSYAWSGLLSPVVAGDSYNLGRTIPLKFALTGASAPVRDLVAKVYLSKVSDTVAGSEAADVSTSAADSGNTFRPDGTGYVFNLATKNLSVGTWRVRVDLGDGVRHTVDVALR
jgi:hypothetical protein